MGLLGSQIALAYAFSSLMKLLKYWKNFPLMQKEAAWLNRAFAAFMAAIATIGIHYTYDAITGVLTITGLTAIGTLTGLWQWFVQFALQQGAFKLIVQPEERRQQIEGTLPRTSLTTGTGDGKPVSTGVEI